MPFQKGKSGNPRGLPKGTKHKATIEKEVAREMLRDLVKANLPKMVEAQVRHAQGISHLMLRDPKTGKFERVVDEQGVDKALAASAEGSESVWIYTKDPSVQAFTDLLNRTIDKPTETLQATVTLSGLDERLRRARKRLGEPS